MAAKTKTEPQADEPQADEPQADDEICRDCWPWGWPDGHHAATCAHGAWQRPEQTM